MRINVELDLRDDADPAAVAQWLSTGKELSVPNPYVMHLQPATQPMAVTVQADQVMTTVQATTQVEQPAATAPKAGRGKGKNAAEAAAALAKQNTTDQQQLQPTTQQTQPVEQAQQPASTIPTSIPTSMPGLPPGITMGAAVVTAPAMPPPQPAAVAPNGAASIEDLRAVCAAVNQRSPQLVFKIMKSEAWSDGTAKPRWLTIDNVPPDQYERLISELSIA